MAAAPISQGELLKDKVAFITGAAQGIGLAVASAYVSQGASVVLADIAREPMEHAITAFPDSRKAMAVALDVTNEEQTAGALRQTLERFGRIDCVVANAGILVLKHVVDLDLASWRRVLDVNLTGAFLTVKIFAQQLVKQQSGGRIIFTSSLFGLRGGRENGAYSASKFGMIGLMQSIAAELAPQNILVNAVCPGQMDTAMMKALFRERAALTGRTEAAVEAALLSRIPAGRLGRTDDLTGVYVYLASDLCQYSTGQSFTVDGGWQVG
jgi:NAD(P)-dependent dehydrogenase (short-subunit alcohol dehydrogenase family)